MEKSCQSSGDSTVTSGSTASANINAVTRDQYLKNLNKLSQKISKPIIHKKPPFDPHLHSFNTSTSANVTASSILNQSQSQASYQQQQQQQQQHQPPVYNINKNDFRDVVQKLTGSPAHERYSTPPPIHPPKPQSSRLQRIRPPPLAHVSNRPPPLLNSALPSQPSVVSNPPINVPPMPLLRPPAAPLSPLPPFPAVHAAAESPVSAYMRILQNSISATSAATFDSHNKQFSGFLPLAPLVSPRWNNVAPPQQQFSQPMSASQLLPFQLPASPLPFGCLNSPRSPHPLLSPGLSLSPSAFPLSPTLPLPSPRWRGL